MLLGIWPRGFESHPCQEVCRDMAVGRRRGLQGYGRVGSGSYPPCHAVGRRRGLQGYGCLGSNPARVTRANRIHIPAVLGGFLLSINSSRARNGRQTVANPDMVAETKRVAVAFVGERASINRLIPKGIMAK